MGSVMTKVIESNTTIPTKKSQVFTTAVDNQPSVEIHILQGERPMAKDNKTIGRFHLDGIPPAPRGVPQIEVSFDIDTNGILNVSAKDKGTGKEHNVRIEASSNLSKDEIEKMKAEAKANEETDKKERERVEKINAADSLVFQTEKQLKDFGDKLSADKKQPIEEAVSDLKQALDAKNDEAIEGLTEKLNAAWTAASEELYKAQQETAGGADANASTNTQNPTGNEPEDVEFEEVK
jgi:molecular chaperone DnaK